MGRSDLNLSLSPTQWQFVSSDAHIAHLVGPMGEGKCLATGTPVLMYDGSIKPVEDVRPGDRLMGDDSSPRNVLSCSAGYGDLYRIVPRRGNPFTCNAEHILSLKRTGEKNTKRGRPQDNHKGEVVDIDLACYMSKSKAFRETRKLYRVGVDFPARSVNIDPYFLGLWLGDGNSADTGITTPDQEIVAYLAEYARSLPDHRLVKKTMEGNAADVYWIRKAPSGRARNVLLDWLKGYNLLHNKHIPAEYSSNSRDVRMNLLAGLADSDGCVNKSSYQWTLKEGRLAADLAYLCRSLGFAASIKKVTKTIKSIQYSGEYFQVGVSGDLSSVPTRIARKRCPQRRQIKNVLVSAIKEVVPIGKGDYHGFVIDGNRRFLLGDFTVTHNTHAAVAGYIYHAKRCGIPLRAALIRDTHQNIKTSTVASIREILGDWVTFRDNYKKMYIKTRPGVEVDLFGIDDEASISKLQGPEYGLIHLEEPAPIHEKANAGLPKAVFDLALARCGRQKGSRPRLQITQNPGDGDHWSTELMEDPEEMVFRIVNDQGAEEDVIVTKKTFHIPPGENRHLTPLQRAMNMAAFKGDPGKWARYVEGKVATVQIGKAVTPEYGPSFHFSQTILPVYPRLDGFRGWDGYQHPAVVLAQYNPEGQLVIHDVIVEEDMGVEELIDRRLRPLLLAPKYKGKIAAWREIGDPSMLVADQSTVTMSAARKIEKMLKTRFEAGPSRWANRIEPVKAALKRTVNEGKPAVILSASAVHLHRALRGGWHYKTDNNGRRLGDLPVKDGHSHPGDAFAYLISLLMPYSARQQFRQHKEKADRMKRAMSYGQPTAYRQSPAGLSYRGGP